MFRYSTARLQGYCTMQVQSEDLRSEFSCAYHMQIKLVTLPYDNTYRPGLLYKMASLGGV